MMYSHVMESSTEREFPAFFSLTPDQYAAMQAEILSPRERIERYTANPYEAVRDAWRAHQRRHYDATSRFWSAIRQAYRRGIPWRLEPAEYEALVAQPCCLCGKPTGKGVGLDRIDHTGPYSPENVRPMCGPCNFARGRSKSP